MEDVLRIISRFKITEVGTIYMINANANIHIGDIYKDLCGNWFRVKGIEMIRRISC